MLDIIIPFRDARKFIENLFGDLESQSSRNFSVYFISDNSEDGTKEFLLSKQANFDFRVVDGVSEGPGGARNTGLDLSENDYVTFIDADDRITNNYVERFIQEIHCKDPDIIECMYKSVDPSGSVISKSDIELFLTCSDRFLSLIDGSFPRLSWGKVFKRSHLEKNNARYPENIYNGEDHIFLLNAYSGNPVVRQVVSYMYSWVRWSNTLTTRSPDIRTIIDFIKVSELKFELISRSSESFSGSNLFIIFSRRVFKEARMLMRQIDSHSLNSLSLIGELQTRLNASQLLSPVMNKIKDDKQTTYWKDVMEYNIN